MGYVVRREEPAGKGVADVAFIPRNPAEARRCPFVVELKAGGTATEAVTQIREREPYSPPSFPNIDPILDSLLNMNDNANEKIYVHDSVHMRTKS